MDDLQGPAFGLDANDDMSAIVISTPCELLFDSLAKWQGQEHPGQPALTR